MRESPRTRRLRSDFKSLEKLKAESSILDFSVPGPMYGGLPDAYRIRFLGTGIWRSEQTGEILTSYQHEVSIELGASYPRMMPALSWRTPIFHPNISASGVVCLGGYGTYWSPSLGLDELCEMLWDMIRYRNFDVNSPYNRDAANWARVQQHFRFPLDDRSIRDRVSQEPVPRPVRAAEPPRALPVAKPIPARAATPAQPDVLFLSDTVVEAEVVRESRPEILFIE